LKPLILALVLGLVIVPPTLLLAPGYQLLFRLNMLDSFWGLIIPAAAPAFGVYLFRQAARSSVPSELLEAARIDGCGELRIFALIAVPLLRPMISAFMLITFLGVWNNFINPQIVLQSAAKFPLSVAVAQLKGVYYQDYGLQIAGTLLSVAPVLGLFLLLQKDFVSGLTSGAVKE
jgi:ABC-type glycerol-3-phosphate transport system permease component